MRSYYETTELLRRRMKAMMFLSDTIIPLLIFCIVGYGLLSRHNIYEEFIEGARDGFGTVIGIMPTLIGLMAAVGILRASGFLEFFAGLFAGITGKIGFPSELLPITLVKMFSSSAATGLLLDIFKEHGADSFLGKTASIMMSSTDNGIILRRNEEYLQRQDLEFVLNF